MKTTLSIMLGVVLAMSAAARAADDTVVVTQSDAREVAVAWLRSSVVFARAASRLPEGESYQVDRVSPVVDASGVKAYVVGLRPCGYVVVAADQRLSPVPAFSTDSAADLAEGRDNAFRVLLLQTLAAGQAAARGLSAGPAESALAERMDANMVAWERLTAIPDRDERRVIDLGLAASNILVNPLLQSSWGQWRHYNRQCPDDPNPAPGYDDRVPAGCVNVAGAQLMNYHRWPSQGWGGHTWIDTNAANGVSGEFSANFDTRYDWMNMQTSYDVWAAEPTSSVAAVSSLIKDVAVATDTDFGSYAAGGSWSAPLTFGRAAANYFNYEPPAHVYRADSPSLFDSAVRHDIVSNRCPVVVSTPTHAVVADGFADEPSGDYFHINYGWGGINNGWYQFSNLAGETGTVAQTGLRPVFMPLIAGSYSTNTLGGYSPNWSFPANRRQHVTRYRFFEGTLRSTNWQDSCSGFDGWQNSGGWSTNSSGYNGGSCFRCPSDGGRYTLVSRDPFVPRSGSGMSFEYRDGLLDDHFRVGTSTNRGRTWQTVMDRTATGPPGGWCGTNVSFAGCTGRETYVCLEYDCPPNSTVYADGGAWVDQVVITNADRPAWRTLSDAIPTNQFSYTVTGRVDGIYYYAVQAYDGSGWGPRSPVSRVTVALDPALDIDGDGMPNGWERTYFGSATGAVAGVDSDGDGHDNRSECWAGTDPRDSASAFRVTSVRCTPQGVALGWSSVSGHTYRVSRAATLNRGGDFTPVGTNCYASSSFCHYYTATNGGGRYYYRVGVYRATGD